MSTRFARPQHRSLRQRLRATAAAVVLPLALVACGGGGGDDGGGPGNGGGPGAAVGAPAELRAGIDSLLDSTSASFELSVQDAAGNLERSIVGDTPDKQALADALLGATVRISVDPAGDKTLRELADSLSGSALPEQLKASDLEVAVATDGSDVLQLRVVEGVLYVNADLDAVDQLSQASGSGPISDVLDSFTQAGPPELGTAIKDLRDGMWLRLDLASVAPLLQGLTGGTAPSPSSAARTSELLDQLLDAVLPSVTSSGGQDGTYDVEIKAEQALTAATGILRTAGIAIPGTDVAALQDGVLKGTLTLDGDSLREVTLDLGSFAAVAPAGTLPSGLTGATVTLAIEDSAEEVAVPDDVSTVDLSALVQLLAAFAGGAGGAPPS